MRIALGLEYDGADFHGWQSQADGRGVQDQVERALAEIAGEPIRVVAAGRTDSGVHASMQVVHFDTSAARPETAWVRGTNAFLPGSVGVRWASVVDAAFHARFAATARHYAYFLLDQPIRAVLLRDNVGWHHRALDLPLMQEAARALIGTHDFSSFRATECQAKSPVKTLTRLDIRRDGALLRLDFQADAFLHHMVRNIIGALVYVGNGRKSPGWVAEVLEGRNRALSAPTFSAAGLYLAGIDYAPTWNLPPTHAPVRIVSS